MAREINSIIVHHSATGAGNVDSFRRYHMDSLGFADVGYHHVITNGNGGPDGQVQPGRPEQTQGAHAKGANQHSIGICLVGDFTAGQPTAKQFRALVEKIAELKQHYPGIKNIWGHKEAPGVEPTACPGNLDMDKIRSAVMPDKELAAGPLYRVQVGAFKNRKNAEDLARRLEALGYTTYIMEG